MSRGPESTVLVDMDGVLADFDSQVVIHLQEEHPHIPLAETRTNFYISEDYPEHIKLVRAISDRPGFFLSLPLVENALEGWQRIIDSGYTPRICSSPLRSNQHSHEEKILWLEKHLVPVFGSLVATEAIIDSDKPKYAGVALIDDRPELNGADSAEWQHVVFDQPYNHSANSELRIYGWSDPNLEITLEKASRLYRGIGGSAVQGSD